MMGFHDKVVYQIYPKSFNDSNGDGVGDLPGIIEKVPYLADLGVDVLWLNPFYPSPQRDNGYDISDYTAVDPQFGTMADFEKLVAVAKEYDMGLMLDMVLNHVSTEHEWFQKALAGHETYQDISFCVIRRIIGHLSSAGVLGRHSKIPASITCIYMMKRRLI